MKLFGTPKYSRPAYLHLFRILLLLLLGGVLAGCGASSSGDSTPAPEDPARLNVAINYVEQDNCPETTLYVTVLDENQEIIDSIDSPDNFHIFEGTTEINPGTVTLAAVPGTENEPITLAILMDHSSSIVSENGGQYITEMKASAKTFVNYLIGHPETPDFTMKIFKFAQTQKMMNPDYTNEKATLDTAIDEEVSYSIPDLGGIGTITRFYDALNTAIDDLAAYQGSLPESGKRKLAIVLLTDGEDNGSTVTKEEVSRKAIQNNIPIFILGVTDNAEEYKAPLVSMANETGGIYFSNIEAPDHDLIYERISEILTTDHYVLTFPSGMGGGSSYMINLTVYDNRGEYGKASKEITACP